MPDGELKGCEVCPAEDGECRGRIQWHHVIERRALRKHGLAHLISDERNRLHVCEWRHEQHTTAYKRIPRSCVPEPAWEFAREIGLDYLIERYYPA